MMTRRTLVVWIAAVAVFSGAAWGGYRFHQTYGGAQQLAQPGWCCLPTGNTCSVSPNATQCRTQGGLTFNWDDASCNQVCAQSQLLKARTPSQPQ